MKRIGSALVLGLLGLTTSCKDFLDVNKNPNAPETVSANLYLAPMLHWLSPSPQFDGRFVGRYTQEWSLANGQTAISTWDRMGYDPASDNGAQQWRDVYWTLGQNLVDMINKAEAEQRWDLARRRLLHEGVGLDGADRPARRDHRQGSARPDALHLRLRHAGIRVQRGPAPARPVDQGSRSAPTAPSTRSTLARRTRCTTAIARSG